MGFRDMVGKVRNFAESVRLSRRIKQAKKTQGDGLQSTLINNDVNSGILAFNNTTNISTHGTDKIPNCPSQYKTPVQCNGDTMKKRQKHYRNQTKIFHPDMNKGCPDIGESKFKELESCCKSDNIDEYLGTCGKPFGATDFVGEN